MQSNELNTANPNDPSAIEGLVAMLIESGWHLIVDKKFYKTLGRAEEHTITLKEEREDFSLACKLPGETKPYLILPQVSKIYPFPLMVLLNAYGVIDLKHIAISHDINMHDILGLEAVVI